ncbi:MAG: hypothetical protein U1E84_05515 [Rhodoferax sp.]
MNNDAYAAALAEIEEGRLDKGTWARAFADSGGDESKAKAFYIKARAESIESAAAWPDTQPPVDDAPKNREAPELKSVSATPATEPTDYYEEALGERTPITTLTSFTPLTKRGRDSMQAGTGRHSSSLVFGRCTGRCTDGFLLGVSSARSALRY